MSPWYKEPFFQVALPIIVMFLFTWWQHNKRIDDLRASINERFEAFGKRIDDRFDALGQRVDAFRAESNRRFDEVNKRLDRLEERSGIYKP